MGDTDKKLDLILNTLTGFKEEFNGFKGEFNGFKEEFNVFKEEFNGYKTETNEKLERMETGLLRLEEEQSENVTALLKQINNKLDEHDAEIQALNKRVFKVEAGMERITQQ